MRNVKAVIKRIYQTRITPYAIVGIAFIFAASVSFALSPQSPLFKNHTKEVISKVQDFKISENKVEENTPSPAPTHKPSSNVLGERITVASPTPKSTSAKQTPTPSQIINQTSGNNISATQNNPSNQTQTSSNAQQSTPIPLTPSPTPTSTPAVITTVNIEIKTPDSSPSFSVELKEGMNVCDVLQKAKDEGKINSLTFDDSYLSTLNSRYVYEINGYKNNWTFTVNENSPLGCSLSNPKPNDTIVWKFL